MEHPEIVRHRNHRMYRKYLRMCECATEDIFGILDPKNTMHPEIGIKEDTGVSVSPLMFRTVVIWWNIHDTNPQHQPLPPVDR